MKPKDALRCMCGGGGGLGRATQLTAKGFRSFGAPNPKSKNRCVSWGWHAKSLQLDYVGFRATKRCLWLRAGGLSRAWGPKFKFGDKTRNSPKYEILLRVSYSRNKKRPVSGFVCPKPGTENRCGSWGWR